MKSANFIYKLVGTDKSGQFVFEKITGQPINGYPTKVETERGMKTLKENGNTDLNNKQLCFCINKIYYH